MVELMFLFGLPIVGFGFGSYLVTKVAKREAESTGGVVLISAVGIVVVGVAALMLFAAVGYFVAGSHPSF